MNLHLKHIINQSKKISIIFTGLFPNKKSRKYFGLGRE